MYEEENFLIPTAYLKVGSLLQLEKSYIKAIKKKGKTKMPNKQAKKSNQIKQKTNQKNPLQKTQTKPTTKKPKNPKPNKQEKNHTHIQKNPNPTFIVIIKIYFKSPDFDLAWTFLNSVNISFDFFSLLI